MMHYSPIGSIQKIKHKKLFICIKVLLFLTIGLDHSTEKNLNKETNKTQRSHSFWLP